MMNLYEKIISIYPDLTEREIYQYIRLQNDSDGNGDYIAEWNHPTLPKPTKQQLDGVQ